MPSNSRRKWNALGCLLTIFVVWAGPGGCSQCVENVPGIGARAASSESERLANVAVSDLLTTDGKLEELSANGWLRVSVPSMRAVLRDATAGAPFRVQFVYRGPTVRDIPLASGELRRQFGVKLRAANTCNVVYVMWHIEPVLTLEVSVKSNPGKTEHWECQDRGYTRLLPSWEASTLPAIEVGMVHSLEVRLEGDALNVWVDEQPAWKGTLPAVAFFADGPVGIRSDNAVIDFTLWHSRTRTKRIE